MRDANTRGVQFVIDKKMVWENLVRAVMELSGEKMEYDILPHKIRVTINEELRRMGYDV
jgi:hypothetical protein